MLTFSAGIVDIVGFIGISHWFVAHMTGNTVHLGNQLVAGNWGEAAETCAILCSFVVGSIAARAVIEAAARKRQRTIATLTLIVEATLILSVIWARKVVVLFHAMPALSPICLLIPLALAMGVQTATITRIGPLTIHTTFVTGMINKFAEAISEWLFWLHDQRKTDLGWRNSTQHPAFRDAGLMFAIWWSYMFGAVAGTWMYLRWNTHALYAPVIILLISVIIDQWRPLAVEEEMEQTRV